MGKPARGVWRQAGLLAKESPALMLVGLSVWLLPAVPKAEIVFDLVEAWVERSELVSDALDQGSHIRPIAIGPVSTDETLIVQSIVDRPVSDVPTCV